MCTLYWFFCIKEGKINCKFMYFIVVQWDVIWFSVVLYTAIFWSLHEPGGISLEKGVRLIYQWTNEFSSKSEMSLIIMQNIQWVREKNADLGGSSLESQDNHPLMMMQVCIWELKAPVRQLREPLKQWFV